MNTVDVEILRLLQSSITPLDISTIKSSGDDLPSEQIIQKHLML